MHSCYSKIQTKKLRCSGPSGAALLTQICRPLQCGVGFLDLRSLSDTCPQSPLLYPLGLVEEAGRTQILPQRGSQLGELRSYGPMCVHLPLRAGQLWPQFGFCLRNP